MSVISPPFVMPGNMANARNFLSSNLPKWRKARANALSGTVNARILYVGDSTTFGLYSNNGTNVGDLKTNSAPSQLARLLQSIGINATWQSSFGSGILSGGSFGNLTNDPRITNVSGFAAASGGQTLGGALIQSSGTSYTYTITPSASVDTFVLYYVKISGGGTFQYNIDGGSNTAVNTNASTAVGSLTISAGTLGPHALNIGYGGASGTVYLIGWDAYNSASKQILVTNAGWNSSTSASWTNSGSAWQPPQLLGALGQALTIINLGINDWEGGTSLSAFQANIQTLITNALTQGDVIIETPNPTNASASYATQQAYISVLAQLAAANKLVLVDNFSRFNTYAAANTLGMMGDTLHPNQLGYADKMALLSAVLSVA